MEFFRIIKSSTSEESLQNQIKLSNLEEFSTEIFNLEDPGENEASIGGIWGEFTLRRSLINGGIRFELVECPNALCWTITTGCPPAPDSVIIHLTINRLEKNEEFVLEIETFLDDMSKKLKELIARYVNYKPRIK
ncbi:MAG: hypothetical protein JSV73_12875 [Flavobacteriaceae bacterium]|nr:MAG: hypothetical protein JSV73_12875 [Flavobacteriaceae bacterium]